MQKGPEERRIRKFPILKILAIVLPVFLAGLIAIFYWIRKGAGPLPFPQWNDEAVYYEQVKMWLLEGVSKGYWGFNGEHALLGTGGAWNPAILFPYVIWGKIFGWHYYSMPLANTFFLCAANAGFLFLTKADRKLTVRLIVLECLSGNLILYMNTGMSEVLRYGLALLLAGMLMRLYFSENKNSLIFQILTGIYLLFLMQVYIFFAFAVPIYIFGVFKNRKIWKKCVLSFLTMAVTAGGSYVLLHLISSNYNIFKTEKLFSALQQKNFAGAVVSFLWMAKVGIHDFLQCFLSSAGHGMFHWFVLFLTVLVLLPAVLLIRDRNRSGMRGRLEAEGKSGLSEKDKILLTLTVYSVFLFTGMYITVYSLEAFTFYRGMGIVVLFSLSALCLLDNRIIFRCILGCYALGLFFVPGNMADFNQERYLSETARTQWTELSREMGQTMKLETASDMIENQKAATDEEGEISAEGDAGTDADGSASLPDVSFRDALRWRNTVVMYTLEPRLICSIPAGFGENYMMYSDKIVDQAGYLVFSKQKEGAVRQDWLEQSFKKIYADHGSEINQYYYLQYQDSHYIIYKHKVGGID